MPNLSQRSSGILLHLSSLQGAYGIGDLGPRAYRFARFLAEAGQTWWQILPIDPPGAGNSPYSSPSAFAASELFLSLETMAQEGLLEESELIGASGPAGTRGDQFVDSFGKALTPAPLPRGEGETRPEFGDACISFERTDYEAARRLKEPLLRLAFERFKKNISAGEKDRYQLYERNQEFWLKDYAIFQALKKAHQEAPWNRWPKDLRSRDIGALARAQDELGQEVEYHKFLQYQFQRQWSAFKSFLAQRSLGLIGDIPLYVDFDSADVWAHQSIFKLDGEGRPSVVAGVPPDYFSSTGQLWGNPVFNWEVLKGQGYQWWVERLRNAMGYCDALRLDHFIGYVNYWEIPAQSSSARTGRWAAGPGEDFFRESFRILGPLNLIAEDLGAVTPEVEALRDLLGLPGMSVLQFEVEKFLNEGGSFFGHDRSNLAVYTGTHDNDTTAGWWKDGCAAARPDQTESRERFIAGLAGQAREIHWDLIGIAFSSKANIAIIPFQDLLGLDSSARMNHPGTAQGNWLWRLKEESLTPDLCRRLYDLTRDSGRLQK